jgi:hypothetical protein
MSAGAGITDNAQKLLALLGSSPATAGLFGGQVQTSNLKISPVRSNAFWPVITTSPIVTTVMTATEVASVVAVPVAIGDVFKTINLPIGSTKGKKVEAGFGALYAGKKGGALLAQSKSSKLEETVVAETGLVLTLETAVEVTAANAPGGFLYVEIALEAETMPTVLGSKLPTTAQVTISKWVGKLAPEALSAKTETGLKETAKATLGTLVALETIPYVAIY